LFGKYENTNRLIPYIINQARNHDIIMLNENINYDYSYVLDVCNAIYSFLKSDITGIVNICSGKYCSLQDIATYICKQFNCSLNNIKFRYNYNNKYIYGSNDRLINDVKYTYKYSIYTGINELIYESDNI
jgi:nucleoside-diphosphate-sugar epimerase